MITNGSIARKFILPADISEVLESKELIYPSSREEILAIAMGNSTDEVYNVSYDVPGKGEVLEATVTRCRNGLAVNYTDVYMRRRDPDCMVVADSGETDKERYTDRFKEDFEPLRGESLDWLKSRDSLLIFGFMAGGSELGYPAMLIAPSNAGFFAGGLADLQGFIPAEELPSGFEPKAIIFLAPPFRHTRFDGRQVVVHNRVGGLHELFSYNLYPGPSAKKGVYGILLNIGEQEGWVTLHGSTVRLVTPYENELTIMHEGASGGGKSEMIGEMHRELDGRILLARNTVTREKIRINLSDTSELRPVTDDMALSHPKLQKNSKKLVVTDAESGWFVRIDHIRHYGTEPMIEKLTIHPKEPLIFLNIDGKAGSTCLIWDHMEDEPGVPCPNPRVIIPRRMVPDTVNEPVEVDVRSFGVRTPPTYKDTPNYGILGMMHVLPPALAWLWRLVAPRGHSNPSIVGTSGLSSEGVGSYWPFATGKMTTQANLLLRQIQATPSTKYLLIPNQHIGAYHVGFMPQWIVREYISRRGGVKFKPGQLADSRCALLGYTPESMKVDGTILPGFLLRVHEQPEVGVEGFDQGSEILYKFFRAELEKFYNDELMEVGKKIIEVCLERGKIEDYASLI
jgi:hypothetical protein